MKIILSRKGFDSSPGGGEVPSPIFTSGKLCSLPVPERKHTSHSRRYEELKMGNLSLGTVVNDLTQGKIKVGDPAHVDPDLNFTTMPRLQGWKPVFGQEGAAEAHLQNSNVKEGDIFIFYGWFRQVEQFKSLYRYVRNAPDLHVIFGWLQIERRISVSDRSEIPLWALDHAHLTREKHFALDSIYISTDYLHLPGTSSNLPGAGTFPKFDPVLCLTAPGMTRSKWRLPLWFYPARKKSGLSYHTDLSRWESRQEHVLLNTVGRGQEFVLDCQDYPEAIAWLSGIFSSCFLAAAKLIN
ncbi:MAG TPA: hypothetical protein VF043_24780 [Ktedonobacteraceae bacterium]